MGLFNNLLDKLYEKSIMKDIDDKNTNNEFKNNDKKQSEFSFNFYNIFNKNEFFEDETYIGDSVIDTINFLYEEVWQNKILISKKLYNIYFLGNEYTGNVNDKDLGIYRGSNEIKTFGFINPDILKSDFYKNNNLWFNNNDLKELIKLKKAFEVVGKMKNDFKMQLGENAFIDDYSLPKEYVKIKYNIEDNFYSLIDKLLNTLSHAKNANVINDNININDDINKYNELLNNILEAKLN